MVRRFGFVLLLVLGGCRACGSTSGSTEAAGRTTAGGESSATGWAPLHVDAIEPGPTAIAIPSTCERGAPELCNAIDDDCSGTIDSGCGYATGQLQITAAWEASVDIDLYVTVPAGDIVSYQAPATFDGGLMDRTSRGRCEAGGAVEAAASTTTSRPTTSQPTTSTSTSTSPTTSTSTSTNSSSSQSQSQSPSQSPRGVPNVENFVYTSRPALGRYVVELHYWGECMSSAGAVDVVVGLSAGGAYLGAYRVPLTPNERTTVVAFELE